MEILHINKLIGKNKSSNEAENKTEKKDDSDEENDKVATAQTSEQLLASHGFKIGRVLGEGSYSVVRAAYGNNMDLAVKIVTRNKISHDFANKFLPREIEALSKLQHKHIIKVYSIICLSQKVYIFMEYLQRGDLLNYVRQKVRLSEKESRHFFEQMVSALQYMHNLHIAHRDLKCENVMLDANNDVRLIDFGFCRSAVTSSGRRILSDTYCGSSAYAAPEVLQGTPYNPLMYDVWSLGCILFIMVAGSMPFDDSNLRRMIQHQLKRKLKFPTTAIMSADAKDLIKSMLQPDVSKRITTEQIVKHSWMQADNPDYKSSKSGSLEISRSEVMRKRNSQ